MDALAQYRHNQNLPALSIDWGPWAEIGMAKNMNAFYQKRGFTPLKVNEALNAFGYALLQNKFQVAILDANWKQAGDQLSFIPSWLSELIEEKHEFEFKKQLVRLSESERLGLLRNTLFSEIRRVLRLPQGQEIDDDKNLFEFGIDSLMALELKNRLQLLLNQPIANTLIMEHPTVKDLSEFLLTIIEPYKAQPEKSIDEMSAEELDEYIKRNS